LEQEGTLKPSSKTYYESNYNVNFFNVDMVYTWQFAPGSFVNVVWKNSIDEYNQTVTDSYFKNLGATVNAPQLNSLSLRVIYFLDYLAFKKK
jgi:hypothetical protein